MVIVGNLDPWAELFPDELIPQIIDLVIAAWAEMTVVSSMEWEVPITQRFRAVLRRFKDLRRLPVTIDRECWEDLISTGEARGRIDLRFLYGYLEDVYFAFECKRLNVPYESGWSSEASEYTGSGGMMCYTSGQYASSLTSGGMIGYVMDGQLDKAISAVDTSIRTHWQELKMQQLGGLIASTLRPALTIVRETVHAIGERLFVIHHIFLTVNVPAVA